MRKFKEIIFDIDGTLLDSNYYSLKTLQETLFLVEGKQYKLGELNCVLGLTDLDVFKKLKVKNVELCIRTWATLSHQKDDYKAIFQGIVPVIHQIREQNIRMGIVTSRNQSQYYESIISQQLGENFDVIITSDITKKHKPHPEPIIKYLELTKTNREDLIYIGDTYYDLLSAKEANIEFALATWGIHQNFECDFILKKPKDILKII